MNDDFFLNYLILFKKFKLHESKNSNSFKFELKITETFIISQTDIKCYKNLTLTAYCIKLLKFLKSSHWKTLKMKIVMFRLEVCLKCF